MLIANEKKLLRYRITTFVVMVLLLGIDQYSKWVAHMRDAVVFNYGGVFGLFPSSWWGGVLTVILILVALYWWKHDVGCMWVAMSLIVVGGLGNVIDRFFFGAVRDFIYYPGFGFYGNVADIYLVLGVVTTLVIELRHEIYSHHTS